MEKNEINFIVVTLKCYWSITNKYSIPHSPHHFCVRLPFMAIEKWAELRILFFTLLNIKTKIMYSDNDTRLTPLPQYVEGIWKRRFHSEDTRKMFSVHTAPNKFENANIHRPFWICVWNKIRVGNHVIFVTSSFSRKKLPFKCFLSGVFEFLQF